MIGPDNPLFVLMDGLIEARQRGSVTDAEMETWIATVRAEAVAKQRLERFVEEVVSEAREEAFARLPISQE